MFHRQASPRFERSVLGVLARRTVLLGFPFWVTAAYGAPSTISTGAFASVLAGKQVGMCLADLDKGDIVYQSRGEEGFIPASVLKLATTGAALEYLGPEFTFKTRISASPNLAASVSVLTVRGEGDPTLTNETLWNIARGIYSRGVRSIGELRIDESAFTDPHTRLGQRAYLSASSALPLNFNSVGVTVCPTSSGKPAIVSADPWEGGQGIRGTVQTVRSGNASVSIDEVRGSSDAIAFEVKGTIGADERCTTIYRSITDPGRYFADTLKAFLRYLGISVARVTEGEAPKGAVWALSFSSKPLREVVQDMNHYSNNFIAEQIVMQLGAAEDGTFDRERGLLRLRAFAERFAVGEEVVVSDGSGLSRKNRITPNTLCRLLLAAHRNGGANVEFEDSLSVAGRNGTLKSRTFVAGVTVRAKTGTLDGVSSLAGYLAGESGKKYAFAILANGARSKEDSMSLEANILEMVAQQIR